MVQMINTTEFNKLVAETEKSLRDTAYVLVGLGVLSFQQAQVRRRELAKHFQIDTSLASQLNETAEKLGAQLSGTAEKWSGTAEKLGAQLSGVGERVAADLGANREQLINLAKSVDERVAPTRAQIDQQIDALEERLPASARNVFSSVRSAIKVPESTFRSAIGLD